MSDTDDSYEYAGEWSCSNCGETRNIEQKLDVLQKVDVLVFALGHSCDSESKSE